MRTLKSPGKRDDNRQSNDCDKRKEELKDDGKILTASYR
jgi:hypothetical protein